MDELKDNCGNCTAFHSDRQGPNTGVEAPGQCRAPAPRAPNKWSKVTSKEWCRDSFKPTEKHKMAKARAGRGKTDGHEGTVSED